MFYLDDESGLNICKNVFLSVLKSVPLDHAPLCQIVISLYHVYKRVSRFCDVFLFIFLTSLHFVYLLDISVMHFVFHNQICNSQCKSFLS